MVERVYVCSNLSNHKINKLVTSDLQEKGIDVFHPSSIAPSDLDHHLISSSVFYECKNAIIKCDVLLVFLDSFGKDSSWEVGFANGIGKRVVGIASSSMLFSNDWMVKHSLDKLLILKSGLISDSEAYKDELVIDIPVCLEEVGGVIDHL